LILIARAALHCGATGYSIKARSNTRAGEYTARLDAQTVYPARRFASQRATSRRMHACRRTQLASLIDFGDIGGAFAPLAGLWQFPRSRIHLNS